MGLFTAVVILFLPTSRPYGTSTCAYNDPIDITYLWDFDRDGLILHHFQMGLYREGDRVTTYIESLRDFQSHFAQ
jgi:hypothetical protein